jgi:uncharacterized membrane protein YgcG
MTTETCNKCKQLFQPTRNAPNCPRCSERETQVITSADVDTGNLLATVVEGILDSVGDAASSVSDAFDGEGGDFGGGGASGDW